jgi:hypothetical protein
MKDFVVFCACQSDRLERLNRHLIRFALNLAAKNISDDPAVGVRVRIDADTEGVVCTENLNPDVVMVKPAEDRV